MHALRSTAQAAIAALLALGAFGVPAWLVGLKTSVDEIAFMDAAPERSARFHAVVHLPPPAPAPEPEAAPQPEAPPAPAPKPPVAQVDPALPPVPVLETAEDAVADAAPPRRRLLPPSRVVVSAATGDAKARKSSRSRKAQCIEGDNPDIEDLGENRFRVARDLVDHYTDDLEEAARLAAVYWHEDAEGKVDGFRIRRIKCGSVLYEAGLRNGDVIHTVNGRPVRNIPQALVAYRKLRKKRSLQLELTREGGSLELHYKLT